MTEHPIMNRYDVARSVFPPRVWRRYREQFRAALDRAPQDVRTETPDCRTVVLQVPGTFGPLGTLYCLCSVEQDHLDSLGAEEHVSVSHGPGHPAPIWDDLVLIRALAWPDDVRVVQELPALSPDGHEWISVPGAEVLHLRHYRKPKP